jgi:ribosome-associated protein
VASEEEEDKRHKKPTHERPTHKERQKVGKDSQALARRLRKLKEIHRARIVLPDTVAEEFRELMRLKSPPAVVRQERRLAAAIRLEDSEAIERAIEECQKDENVEARQFQRLERWRARLLDEDGAIEALAKEIPDLDREEMAKMVKKAREERDFGSSKGAGKKLFRRLRVILEG